MKFKYVLMACAALVLGATSCSKEEGNVTPPEEGAETFMSITLKQDVAATRYLTENAATPAETEIKSAKVYVFSSVKVLEQVVEFNAAELAANSKTFKTTVGTHYFIATANEPAGITVQPGVGLYEMNTVLNGIDKNKFDTYTVNDNFFMTSGVDANTYRDIETASRDVIAATEAEAKTKNPVVINIGRAMAKLSFTFEKTAVNYVPSVKEVGGKLDNVQYVVTNNTTAMYYMPHFVNQLFVTPYYQAYNDVFAPTDYWPALHKEADLAPLYKNAAATATDKMTTASYMMENSNEFPTYGDATIVSVKAQFTPDADNWRNAAGTVLNPTPASGNTFYRIYLVSNKGYHAEKQTVGPDVINVPVFFASIADADAYAALKTFGTKDVDYEVHTYTNSICYYIIPVRDHSKTSAACYDVIRNHYFDMAIKNVKGCGYPGPGGDDETDPKDPLDPQDYYVEVSINVLPWVKIQQSEDLDLRP